MSIVSHRGLGETSSITVPPGESLTDADGAILVTDEATLIAAIATLGTTGGRIKLPYGNINISSSIRIHGASGLEIVGLGNRGSQVTFTSASGRFDLDQCQDCVLRDFKILAGVTTSGEMIRITDTDTHSNNQRSSRVKISNIFIQCDFKAAIGINIYLGSVNDRKNDHHTFTNVQIQAYTNAGVRIEGQAARNIVFFSCIIQARDVGLYGIDTATVPGHGGSFFFYGGEIMENQAADFRIGDRSGPSLVSGTWFEQSYTLLDVPDYSDAPESVGSQREMYPITFEAIRWGSAITPANGRIVDFRASGPLRIVGCQFGNGVPNHNLAFHVVPKFDLSGFEFSGNSLNCLNSSGHFTGRWPDTLSANFGMTGTVNNTQFQVPALRDDSKAVPVKAEDWLALGMPIARSWHQFQESGTSYIYDLNRRDVPKDMLLRNGCTLGNTVSGWSGTWGGLTGISNEQFSFEDTLSTFTPTTQSVAVLFYFRVTSANAEDVLCVMGNGASTAPNGPTLRFATGGRIKIMIDGNTTIGTYDYRDSDEHVCLFVYNRTAGRVRVFTDREGVTPITGVYSTGVANSEKKGFGSDRAALNSFTGLIRFGAWFVGANAETVDTVDSLTKMGWTYI